LSQQYDVTPAGQVRGEELRADCGSCFGLCCVALPFTASADFAITKAAGQPCPNLAADFRCGVHGRLRGNGFAGCAAFDCFGAGQKVSQVTFGGRDWRAAPDTARPMFDAFAVQRQLHELLWYLTQARRLPAARPVHGELDRALRRTDALTRGSAAQLAGLEVAAYRGEVNALLVRASDLARGTIAGRRDHRGADLVGADLRGARLRGANLRGALLVAADLRGADLGVADLTGADLRDADVRGTDLAGVIFLAQGQVNAARGDAATGLPAAVARPTHW
jgi:uncharacterized protein YjbI with pentapeptide repeats